MNSELTATEREQLDNLAKLGAALSVYDRQTLLDISEVCALPRQLPPYEPIAAAETPAAIPATPAK